MAYGNTLGPIWPHVHNFPLRFALGIFIRGLALGTILGHTFLGRNAQAELAIGIRVGSRFLGRRTRRIALYECRRISRE